MRDGQVKRPGEVIGVKEIKLKSGTGFWCLDYYPWGGDFGRLQQDVTITDYELLHSYNDGTPSQIIATIQYGSLTKKCGFQL